MATAEIVTERTGMSLDEFMQRRDERFELIDGEFVSMSPTMAGHDIIKRTVYDLLRPFVIANQLGELFFETAFTVTEFGDPKWLKGSLVPDVMFFARTPLTEYRKTYPSWHHYPYAIVPGLMIEVQSDGDSFPEVLTKVAYALRVGVKEAWVINQAHETVTVYLPNTEPVTYSADQTLTSALLPGWALTVRELFVNTFEAE